jgi:hypothetical protein
VRAIYRDSRASEGLEVFIDSDGLVSENTRAGPAPGFVDINDSSWHMVTLTTRPQVGECQALGGI